MWLKDSRCEKVVKDTLESGQMVGLDWVGFFKDVWSGVRLTYLLGIILNLVMWEGILWSFKQN